MQKGTRGTRYNVINRRDKSLTIRISEAEDTMIREKAKLLNMSLVDFVVHACNDRRVKGYNKKDFKE